MRQTIDFGIDLGTTNSAIALFGADGILIYKDGPGETIPSVVRLDKKGNIYVGATAYDKLHHDSPNTASEFKRLMGTEERFHFRKADRTMLPEELSAHVLQTLCALPAERGEIVDAAVITVPAMFEIPACEATKRAAELAGLRHVALLPEPIAAAYAYGFASPEAAGLVLVYDLGGGTFDASILKTEEGRLSVVDHDGDNHLGGKNFDWLIVDEIFVPALAERFALPDLSRADTRYEKLFGKLKAIAEKAKIDLSRMDAIAVYEEDLGVDDDDNDIELDIEIARERYEELIAPKLTETVQTCLALLDKNNLNPSDISTVLLVGGPTRTPLLRARVEQMGIPIELNLDPMTVVAKGAAIFARSQRRPAHLTEVEREKGTVYATLEYQAMTDDEETLLGGRLEAEGHALPSGCTIEVVRADGQWESGRIPLRDNGTFVATVALARNRTNELALRLHDKKGQPLPLEPGAVTITHGLRTDEAPMRSTIRLGLADGSTQVVLEKGTVLPATSREIRLRTVRPIRPGADDAIEIPILEGEQERGDRNRDGGKLVISASRIRRELPAGSSLELTMTVDATGVPERVTVYSELLDEWFDDYKRATTEFADEAELTRRLDHERARIAKLKKDASDIDDGDLVARVRQLEVDAALRDVRQAVEALRGGDRDAAGVARNRLILLAGRIDVVETVIVWPTTLRAYEAERADCRRVVHEHGKREHEEQLGVIEEEAEDCIRRRDDAGLARRTQALLGLEFSLLREQPAFWFARFRWLSEQKSRLTDRQRGAELIREGNQALGRDDLYTLKSVCDNLAALLPRDLLDQAPTTFFRSDVEI